MTDELAERVERGAALLDERRPGWWDEVDVGSLYLGDPTRCVLGQLWEDSYGVGLKALEMGTDSSDRYGFSLFTGRYKIKTLTNLWRAAIERRRA
jgi:hypothetical protein